jgi:membrane associated rhomboid family serine protease
MRSRLLCEGMIEDRYYMRRPSGGVYRSATFTLIVLNVVAFLIEFAILGPSLRFTAGASVFALSADGLRHGYVWQLITFQFMHGGLIHLLLNCLAIYVFGTGVEEALGRKSFYALYFSSGIFGGLVQAGLGMLLKGTIFEAPVVGASAGAFGLTAAFALLYPDSILMLLFVIPVRAKYLLPLSAAMAIAFMLMPSRGGNVAHAAHLGGMVAGYVFVRYAVHWQFRWPSRAGKLRRRPSRRLIRVPANKPSDWRDTVPVEEDLPPDEFLSKEVDPILEKITAHGMSSLTERERRILERAGTKVGKR